MIIANSALPASLALAGEYKKQTPKRKEEDSNKLVFYNFEATIKISVKCCCFLISPNNEIKMPHFMLLYFIKFSETRKLYPQPFCSVIFEVAGS